MGRAHLGDNYPCPQCGGPRSRRPSGCNPNGTPRTVLICTPCHTKSSRQARAKGGGNHKEYYRAWRVKNKEKTLAHRAVERARVAGLLERQPCSKCGTTNRVHAHHDDYSRPLDIIWLCPLHHKERHRELGSIPIRAPSPPGDAATCRGSPNGLPALSFKQSLDDRRQRLPGVLVSPARPNGEFNDVGSVALFHVGKHGRGAFDGSKKVFAEGAKDV